MKYVYVLFQTCVLKLDVFFKPLNRFLYVAHQGKDETLGFPLMYQNNKSIEKNYLMTHFCRLSNNFTCIALGE